MPSMDRAAALFEAGRLDEAEALCRDIEREEGGAHFYAWHLLSVIAARRDDPVRSAEFATRALEIDPRHVEALCNRGAALRMMDRHDAALADYDRALALSPDHVDALNNRGVALAALNRYGEARAAYDRALALEPGHARARFNRALARLVTGDFGGFADFEARWTGSDTQRGPRAFAAPQWSGREDLRGRTLLLHAEQGLGDAIQFARYVPSVARRGATVLLEAHAPLVPLLAELPGVARAFAFGDPLPRFDLHCPLMSLPLAFATTLETIPASVPYLAAPAAHLDAWRERLGPRARPRVGLAWSGSPTLRNDRNRSIPLAAFQPLRELPLSYVALQKDVRPGDRDALAGANPVDSFGDSLGDFRDTAALVELMDLVISVDTSIAHLAGALGKPVWLLLPFAPDWRWMLDRSDSPWYPTARLFRQQAHGDWAGVMRRVSGELRQSFAAG